MLSPNQDDNCFPYVTAILRYRDLSSTHAKHPNAICTMSGSEAPTTAIERVESCTSTFVSRLFQLPANATLTTLQFSSELSPSPTLPSAFTTISKRNRHIKLHSQVSAVVSNIPTYTSQLREKVFIELLYVGIYWLQYWKPLF